MSNHIPLSLLIALSIAAPAFGQEPERKPATPVLTQQQVDTIVKQLAELEKTIAAQRSTNLGAILQKLRTAATSDAAALALYEDCETLVADRRALTRDDKKAREDQIKRQADRNKNDKGAVVKEEGDFGTAVRLQLRYLILSLQAHETKDKEQLLPDILGYLQDVAASAEKLKGRAGAYLATPLRAGGGGGRRGPGGGGGQGNNPFVAAFQLEPYLDNPEWSMEPLDFGNIYEKSVFPTYREKKKSELGTQWDARMSAEAALRKGSISEAEFAIWQQTALLDIKWLKLKDVYANGDKPVNALADMLAMIRDNPGHPDSPKWLDEFRGLVAAAVPGSAATPPATAP
jgi:hypothetical protein